MRKTIITVSAVSAIVLFILYLIGALSNTDKLHDIHAGIEDRAIMQTVAYADDEFVKSAKHAAEFVSKTIESGHEYNIFFCIETSDGSLITIEQNRLAWNDGLKWRKKCKENVFAELMNDKQLRDLYDAGGTATKLSTTISYMHEYCIASVCDTDNDGFVDEKHVSSL